MRSAFVGVDRKLWRADDHLEACFFKRATAAARIVNAGADAVIGEFDPGTNDYVFRLTTPPLDPEIGVIVGEFAHNLRSALDIMLWQVILARGGRPRIGVTQFPIYEDEAKFKGKAEALTRGVSREDFAFIEAAQPFNNRRHPHLSSYLVNVRSERATQFAEWHPLALLSHVNNVDKHRYLHPTISGPVMRWRHPTVGDQVSVFAGGRPIGLWYRPGKKAPVSVIPQPVSPDGSVLKWTGFSFQGRDDDPAEVMRVFDITPRLGRQPKMEMEPRLSFDVAFSDRERKVAYYDLVEMRDRVREIVAHFAQAIGVDAPRTRGIPLSM